MIQLLLRRHFLIVQNGLSEWFLKVYANEYDRSITTLSVVSRIDRVFSCTERTLSCVHMQYKNQFLSNVTPQCKHKPSFSIDQNCGTEGRARLLSSVCHYKEYIHPYT